MLALFMQSIVKITQMHSKKDFKIYLLDDDIFYINIFQQHLSNLGYNNSQSFSDAMNCFDHLNPAPDIIFYDQGVDFVKGLEVLKRIKRLNPDIYLIFICSAEEVETVIQSLKYGAFDYFVKGENDSRNIEMVLTKIHRVRELLQKNNIVRFNKFQTMFL